MKTLILAALFLLSACQTWGEFDCDDHPERNREGCGLRR